MTANSEDVLSIDEAADFLHLGRSTVAAMVAASQIPSIKVGRRRLFLRSDLLGFLADRRVA